MGKYSGVHDLLDHINGIAGWYDKNGNKIDETYYAPRYGDLWKDFLEFKRRTGGVIHQHHKVVVSKWNRDEVKAHCPDFDYIETVTPIKDNRCKEACRYKTNCTYIYYNKQYTLKELNKKGVYITLDIHFDTLLDLIPYFPYTVALYSHNEFNDYVVISNEPNPIKERNESIEHGGKLFDSWQNYAHELQELYRYVVLNYYNPSGRECVELVEFKPEKQDGKYIDENMYKYYGKVSNPIDENFPLVWVFDEDLKLHWTSPKILNANKGWVEISKEDYNYYIGHSCKVAYVKQEEQRKVLLL